MPENIAKPHILITGANGFIGKHLSIYLQKNGHMITETCRRCSNNITHKEQQCFSIGDIDNTTQWQTALTGIDQVIHLAARVHIMQETDKNPLAAFRLVNTEGTLNLAKQAVRAGVKRFIYLSTIKVNGEETSNTPFFADDQPVPQDPYAISKLEAEQKLLELGLESGLEVVIIRPPLVYGSGVKGNFERLINLMNKSIPLPFLEIHNTRSLVSIQNLCSFIQTCVVHPKAVNEIFLVSDGQDLSTSELLKKISHALNKKNTLFYLPKGLLKFLSHILGRNAEYQRLTSSLQLDITKNQQLLNWQPIESVDDGIAKACLPAL